MPFQTYMIIGDELIYHLENSDILLKMQAYINLIIALLILVVRELEQKGLSVFFCSIVCSQPWTVQN